MEDTFGILTKLSVTSDIVAIWDNVGCFKESSAERKDCHSTENLVLYRS